MEVQTFLLAATQMLSAQLQQSSSLNAALLKSHRNQESYLFTPQQARLHDIDAVFQLAQNGLHLLATSSKQIKSLNSPLFTPSAKFTDRTRISVEENAVLDAAIEKLLFAISPFLMEQAASKIIEWLVRRYRVNEFNVDALLAVFLPYHSTPHFVKLLSILHIPQNSAWTFLNAHKKALTPLHQETLIKEMLSNPLFASIIVNILARYVSARSEHRAAIGFALAVTMQYISQATLDSVSLTFLLPAIMQPLAASYAADVANACLVLLGQLSLHVPLSAVALTAILSGIPATTAYVEPSNIVMSIALILKNQPPLARLPEPLIDFLLSLSGLPAVLTACEQWLTAPAFLQSMATSLCSRVGLDAAYNSLSALFSMQGLSSEGVTTVCAAVFRNWTSIGEKERIKLLPLIRRSYQLFPEEVRLAAEKVESDATDMDSNEIQNLVHLITLPPGENMTASHRDATILTSSADPSLRARGARTLLAQDAGDEAFELKRTAALALSTMEDTHADVLQALYSKPQELVHVVGMDAILQKMERLLGQQSRSMSADVLSAHISFLAAMPKEEAKRCDTCGTLLFSHLLVTKSGFKRSATVWTALLDPKTVAQDAAFLRNCSRVLTGVDWKEMRGDQAAMAKFNERVVGMITTNLVTSPQYDTGIHFLLAQAQSNPLSASAALALATLYNVLNTINGARKLDLGINLTELVAGAGLSALQTVEAKSVSEAEVKGVDHARIVSKPEHQSTHGRLYAAILLLLPMLPRLSSPQMNWLSETPATVKGRSATFSRALYILLNRSNVAPNLCTLALRGLFLSLQDDALLLLASIWSDVSILRGIRIAALKHAEAFIRALLDQQTESISKDLQVVFPFFLGAVYDANQTLRQAAVTCISLLASVRRGKGGKSPEVYALKSLPEEISAKIKFLDWQDFLRYSKAIASHAEELRLDSAAIVSVHEEILQVGPDDPGKDSRYKRRILSCLLSHVVAWPAISLRIALLASTSSIQDVNKLSVVAPLIQELSKDSTETLAGLDEVQRQVYVNGLLSAFIHSEPSVIAYPTSPIFPALLELVRKTLSEPEKESALRGVPSTMKTLTPSLSATQKLELCTLLISIVQPAGKTETLGLLAEVLNDDETLVALLQQLRPISADEQPAKRPRLEATIDPLLRLSKACQALLLSPANRSIIVLSALLDSLDATLDARSMDQAELAHIQQVIMTALSHTAQFVSVQTEVTKQLRIDVLVKLIRDSENPQIIHQALLVVGALAHWSSDSLLHHLMPILLSTGSYISPREDVYSARVAEKTIDSVIPVLTLHLRGQFARKGLLQIAAKPYLDIFVDAATAIPSHRRTSFFMHLISVLGPADFLNPICILLLEPVIASDDTKRRQAEKVSLAIAIMQTRPFEARLTAIAELLEDVVADNSTPQPEGPTFLSSLRDSPNEMDMGRIIGIVDLVHQTLQHSRGTTQLGSDEAPQRILAALVRLLAGEKSRDPSEKAEKLHQCLRIAVKDALRLVSASTMLFTCLQLLRSNDSTLQIELYSLLASSLPDVNADARAQMSSDIVLMIRIVRETLVVSQGSELSIPALKALQAITKSARATELSALTETVPVVTGSLQVPQLCECAVQTLHMLCTTLGPRIIPELSSVIEGCCALLHLSTSSNKLLSTPISLLRHLLDSASSFWTVDSIEVVLYTYVIRSTAGKERDRAAMNRLGKYMARKLPTQVFVAALVKTWKILNSDGDSTHSQTQKNAIFVVMKQGIKVADRALITVDSRTLLNVILEAWDGSEDMGNHTPSIKAFVELVVKLNEASFKPLYRIMFDWAWAPTHESTVFSEEHRVVAYCQAMSAMQRLLKGLVTPYMAPLVGRAVEALDLWSQAPTTFVHFELWRKILELVKLSVEVDDGAFWRDESIRLMIPSLVRQIQAASNPQQLWMPQLLAETLSVVGSVVVDDGFLKALNLDLLMKTREEAARTRLCALECVGKLWSVNGRRLASWKHETIPFLHECAEDENGDVVAEARRLKGILDQF